MMTRHMGSTPPDGKVLRIAGSLLEGVGEVKRGRNTTFSREAQKGFTTTRMTMPTIKSAGTSFMMR